ncbi:hypothetical protein KJY73_11415 [Bowmanella sp. Y26]|uniref:hypothetical protein n=1 Tax=Bowmanella yangjiangensis TaxID=2811230 RepID=UPI001BDC5225|nr:hypothetical protein [Bowmanella yangjiangensis]MBT1064188.1 hypothetical protein [Bowmanella yangjiangensis]
MKTIYLIIFLVFTTSCANKQSGTTPPPNSNLIATNIVLQPIKITEADSLEKVKAECTVIDTLNHSLKSNSEDYNLNFIVSDGVSNPLTKEWTVDIKITELVSHQWKFMSIRPSSVATFEISLHRQGESSRNVVKTIGSGVALGACDRLEKIATAAGIFTNKWIAKQI